jgi:hypothetical protein
MGRKRQAVRSRHGVSSELEAAPDLDARYGRKAEVHRIAHERQSCAGICRAECFS